MYYGRIWLEVEEQIDYLYNIFYLADYDLDSD